MGARGSLPKVTNLTVRLVCSSLIPTTFASGRIKLRRAVILNNKLN